MQKRDRRAGEPWRGTNCLCLMALLNSPQNMVTEFFVVAKNRTGGIVWNDSDRRRGFLSDCGASNVGVFLSLRVLLQAWRTKMAIRGVFHTYPHSTEEEEYDEFEEEEDHYPEM